ncbi:MAG: hypothetical protein NXH82_05185 [Rhodobacteraceae bacterium]|nr:hypothetical protein [Paracoccaceae bacterium]
MTALKKYQRLEATALWRASPDDQRREVVLSLGEATLTISDMNDSALTHWSLAAIQRVNPGTVPAIYVPDGDPLGTPGETLEIAPEEDRMIAAIETLRNAVDRARPRPGRLRLFGGLLSVAAVAALAVFWLPGALQRQTLAVLPDIKRAEIGAALLERIERLTGPVCINATAAPALRALATRTGVGAVVVVPSGLRGALVLPGGTVVINSRLVEDYEAPDVVAGHIAVARARAALHDPLTRLLDYGGTAASLRLLTTGALDGAMLTAYAEGLLTRDLPPLGQPDILAAFAELRLRSEPYAYSQDSTGETVLGLIEADPMAGLPVPQILRDRDWLLLQSICEV